MPYLRLTCPVLSCERRAKIVAALTDAVNDLFFDPRARVTREELRERTTIHFVAYGEDELFIGGRTPAQRGVVDITCELSDWSMPVRMQRRIARELTPILARLFNVPPSQIDNVNLRFYSYRPRDFAVGGRLLSDMIPRFAQILKRTLSA
ncbi:MAG: hypothetical protein JOZ97_03495 [Candidatus Eremiobacteraeota bacterium]|nr:hypothetical protein [Candidatus Eremiobacteraeota bacterium]